MGQILAKGFEEVGGWLGGLFSDTPTGRAIGNVFKNGFQLLANSTRVADDLFGMIPGIGTAEHAAETGIAKAMRIGGAADKAGNLPADLIKSGAGVVSFLKNPASEKSINSWYDENVDPYFSSVPGEKQEGAWQTVFRTLMPFWATAASKLANDRARDSKHGADLTFAQARRIHDIQVRAAGNIIGQAQLAKLTDPGRRYNHSAYFKSHGFLGRSKVAIEELAEARGIWDQAKASEKRRIETRISGELITERAKLHQPFGTGPPKVFGPAAVTPHSQLV